MTTPNNQGSNPVNTQPAGTNQTPASAQVNNPQKPIGVYRPVDTPAQGDYSSEVDTLANIAKSAAFEAMNKTMKTSGGFYLEFAKIKDQETFNTNFASQFTELTSSFTASLESQLASSSAVDQLKEDIRLVKELLETHISSANNTDDMFNEIDTFLYTHGPSGSDDISPQTIFKIKSLAVTALQNTYSCVDGQVVKNAYGYLTNLSAHDQDEINKFLQSINLGDIDDVSHCDPLLEAIATLVMGAGISELPNVETLVKKLFAEQDPKFAAESRKYNDALSAMRMQLDEYVKQTDKGEQAKIKVKLDAAISSFNSLFPPVAPVTPLDINTLIDNSASTNIIAAETSPQKALQLDPSVSFPQLTTLYNQLKAEAYPAPPVIDQARLEAAIKAMESASKRFNRSLYFVDSMQVKLHYPKSIGDVLGVKNLENKSDFNTLKDFIAPNTPFKSDQDVNNHIGKVSGKYGITITRQQLLGGGSWDQYDSDKVNVDEIIGLKPGVDFPTAHTQFDNIITSLSSGFKPTTFKSALSLFNRSVQKTVDTNLFVEEVTTPRMAASRFPANEFELLGVTVTDLVDLQGKLTPAASEDVSTYVTRCSRFGVAFDPDVISAPKIDFSDIDSLIKKGLEPTQTINITPDQAAMSLMGIINNIHACKLDPSYKLSPEAMLKSGVLSFVQNNVRREFDNLRQKFQTQELNKKQVKKNLSRRAFKRLEKETYFIDYKEAILSLAVDYNIFAASSNTALKNQLEKLAYADKIEDFEAQAKNMTDQQLLTVCAELNSFAEGNRKSERHDDKNIMFKSDKDIAQVRRFNSFAIDFIEKRATTKIIKKAKLESSGFNRVDKLRSLSSITSKRMSKLASIVDRAYTGSQKPANYRFMLGVKQELDECNKNIRNKLSWWSTERSFSAGSNAKRKLEEQISKRGFSAISKHGNLISNYGRVLTTVSDLLTSPIWLTRKGFKPTMSGIGYTASSLWKGASWCCTTPFKTGYDLTVKAFNKGLYGTGWLMGLPIRFPYNVVTGTWKGAVAA